MLQISKLGMWDHLGCSLFKTKALFIKPPPPPKPQGGYEMLNFLHYLCQTKYY
jgi:hypothetical protein